MGFTLDKVVPWGRSYDEYVSMFSLTESDLELRVLGCGDGPTAFNSALSKRGGNVVSVDPIYVFRCPHLLRVALAMTLGMKPDIAFNPIHISFFSAETEVKRAKEMARTLPEE